MIIRRPGNRKNRDGIREHLLWKNKETDRMFTCTLCRYLQEYDIEMDTNAGSAGALTGESKEDPHHLTVRSARDYDGVER